MSLNSSLNFRQVDDLVSTSGSVAAEDLAGLAAQGYEVVVNLLPEDSPYAVAGEADIVVGQGLDYVHIPVDFAAPTADDFAAFTAALDAAAAAGRMVHVHCAANYRVSAFYSLYAMGAGRWSAAEADEHISGIWNPVEHPGWEPFIAAERARLEA